MGNVIYLNGTSSAGKTTLATLLQERFSHPFLLVGIDLLIRHMLPKKFFLSNKTTGFYWKEKKDQTGHPIMQLHMDENAVTSWKGMVHATVGLLEAGNHVIIDDVAFAGTWQVDYWKNALKKFNLLVVGVKCPLEEIERRELARGDRMQHSARAQYDIVHEGVEYDLTVDTLQLSPKQAAQKIINAFEKLAT